MTMTPAQFTNLLDPAVRHHFNLGFNRRPGLLRPVLFDELGSEQASEKALGMGNIGVDAWDTYANAGEVAQVGIDEQYLKTFTHVEKALDVVIKRSLYDDSPTMALAPATKTGESAQQKREWDAASVFNNAFSDTGPDGVSLCDDSHPDGKHKSGTQDNALALALTQENVETAVETMMGYTDENGNPLGLVADLIIVPTTLRNEVKVVTNSIQRSGTADNDDNPVSDLRYVVWPFLTDVNAWFMVDSVAMKQALKWFNRTNPEITFVRHSQVEYVWQAYMRYSYGYTDWRWIIGSNPS